MDDFYNGGAFLRRWFIDNTGQAVCPFDAIEVATTASADIDAIVAANAVVRERIAAVEAYEAAQRIRAGEQPPRDEDYIDENGEERTRWSDAYHAWFDAGNTVEDATPETIALAETRATGGVVTEVETDEETGEIVREIIVSTPEPLVDDFVFSDPVLPVPVQVTNFQARVALRAASIFDLVEPYIASIQDPVEKAIAQEGFERASFVRSSPMVQSLALGLGLSEDQVDDLFRQASMITV